jgi:hypothetical protein
MVSPRAVYRHQRCDLPGPPSQRPHVVRAKGEREQILASKRLERLARPWIRFDRGTEIARDLRGLS